MNGRCIESACEACVDALLVEHMYAMQASGFESAAAMTRTMAAKYFTAGQDDLAKAIRDFAGKLDEAAKECRRLQKVEEAKEVVCTKTVISGENT